MESAPNTRPQTPMPPAPPSTPTPSLSSKTYPFLGHALSPISGLHTILGKKANRSSSLSQVVNSFDSSPSLSDTSMTLLDSPFRNKADYTPKQRASFYNPRTDEDSESETDSDDEAFTRDNSPDFHEGDNRIRARSRSSKGYVAPKRWPERLKESDSSGGSSGMGTGASNSTTSLIEIPPGSMGRQTSPELMSVNVARGSMSDIGSEDLPLRKLSVSRETLDNRNLSPFPKSLQRIAQTLAEESAPSESDMRREGMLYRYLRDYTPNSPLHSPLDGIPYELDPDDDLIDSQPWWTDHPQHGTKENTPRRESSPSVDAMETSNPPTRGQSVPPLSIPESFATRRLSSTTASLNGDTMHLSPTNVPSMPPPMVPQLARMKRKAEFAGLDAATAIKRRNISPGSSPLLSPITITSGRERRVLNLQDTHNGLEKMSLQD